MNTEPIYELRERLRAAAMAGTNLLAEDFRLKRALEAFKPMEAASPVFAKVGQLTGQLTAPDCPNPQGALLDAITLTDAVICTLGTVDVAGEVDFTETLNAEENAGSLVVNAPYSALKELLEALTTSGGGHYGFVCETHDNHPELFRDYRVKHTLVQALGASYAELADKVEQWMIEDEDKTVLPALYRDFDPKGKKEMVRRVRVISTLAGAEANDFYVRMLGEAQKEVRTELIDALRHEPRNLSMLFDLSKTEKGKNKDKVFELLAEIQGQEVNDFFKELAKKKPDSVLQYLKNSTTEWSAELVADICNKMFEKLDAAEGDSDKDKKELLNGLQDVVRAMFGKGGTRICGCYRKLLERKDQINVLLKETLQETKKVYEYNVLQYGVLTPCMHWNKVDVLNICLHRYKIDVPDIEAVLGKVLHHSLIVNPDEDLQALALELYQNGDSGKTNIKFLSAAATVKFSDRNCLSWLEEQVMDKVLLVQKFSKERLKAVIEAVNYVCWDRIRTGYRLSGTYVDVSYSNGYNTCCQSVGREIELPQAKEIINWIQKYGAMWDADKICAQWVPLDDEAMCREMGAYFYQRALSAPENCYYEYMKKFGWTKCQGLGISVVRNNSTIPTWSLYSWLTAMPGDKDAVMEEMRTVCRMIKSGELKAKNLDIINLEILERNMDKWYKA
ncbi:MAG: hypothetical protein K2N95_11070 [Lachnospiraceae bacterium]|nr:hypothetical protein [Lachnospiraceae bacterium]